MSEQSILAMDFRRAYNTALPLSVLVMQLKPSRELAASSEVTTAYGDAVKAVTRKLHAEDTLYHFAPGVFGVLFSPPQCPPQPPVAS